MYSPAGRDTTDADDSKLRAYAQWVSIKINNNGTIPIQLKGLGIWWGKLYANGKSCLVDACLVKITHLFRGISRKQGQRGRHGLLQRHDHQPVRIDGVECLRQVGCRFGH